MIGKRAFLTWWLGGLAIFAVSLVLHAPLAIEAVPGGILDHQAAPNASEVDRIQSAWGDAGLMNQARLAMASDLIFILVYSLGALSAGRFFRAKPNALFKALGWAAIIAASVFFITDFIETLLQFYQAIRLEGSDTLSFVASSMGSTKVVSFLVSFGVVVIALITQRVLKGFSS